MICRFVRVVRVFHCVHYACGPATFRAMMIEARPSSEAVAEHTRSESSARPRLEMITDSAAGHLARVRLAADGDELRQRLIEETRLP